MDKSNVKYKYIYIYIHPWVLNQNEQCKATIELIVNNIPMYLSRGLNIYIHHQTDQLGANRVLTFWAS